MTHDGNMGEGPMSEEELLEGLKRDGEKLRQLTGEDHGPFYIEDVMFNEELKKRTLAEMKALNLPKVSLFSITEVKEGCDPLDAKFVELMDKYLVNFVQPPAEGSNCVRCGTEQTGLMGALLGGFTWGLVHGEGFCANCYWPGRALHYIKDAEGTEIASMRMLLQYHPDALEERKETHDDS